MVISKSKEKPQSHLTIDSEEIEEVDSFNYLGSLITSDSRCTKEIRKRIAIAKGKFRDMRSIFTNRNLSMKLKIRLLKCYVWSILTYGCEAWTITPDLEDNIKAAEMWFLRRIMKISYLDRVTNEEVLRRAGVERELLANITKRQFQFLGHIIRKGTIECISLQGRIDGKRARGRQRTKYMDRIKALCGAIQIGEVFNSARNRNRWKFMTAQACITCGT